MANTEAQKKLVKAKVNSQNKQPFFYYLVMNMKLIETPEIPTAGVDALGNLYYNPHFINQFDSDRIFAILSHEVGHLIFEHFKFKMDNKQIANISMDCAINYLLRENNINLPEIFSYKDEEGNSRIGEIYTIGYSNSVEIRCLDNYELKDINNKNSNQIYDELMKNLPEEYKKKGNVIGEGIFDDHSKLEKGIGKGKENTGKCMGKSGKELSREMKKKITEAATFAKMKGNFSSSLQKFTDMILDKSMNWKQVFRNFLQKNQPSGYNWKKPNKRLRPLGIYMPKKYKENVEFITAIDTSGSISKEDFNDFANELLGMINGHKNIKGKVLQWDTKVENEFEVTKATIPKDLESEGRCGYGGTSVSCIKPYLDKKRETPKLLIILTDGHIKDVKATQLPDCKRIWVITKDGNSDIPEKLGDTTIKIN